MGRSCSSSEQTIAARGGRPTESDYVRTRHDLTSLLVQRAGMATLRVEPATLTLASALNAGAWGEHASARSAGGLLAAVVQQRLTTAEALLSWCDRRYCQDLWMRLFQAASCWSGEAVPGSTSSPFLKVAPART